MIRSLGPPCRITYDALPGVELAPEHILRTHVRHRLWLVLTARRVRSKHPTRFALEVVSIDPRTSLGGRRVHSLVWYPRGRR